MTDGDPLALTVGPAGGPTIRVEWDAAALGELNARPLDGDDTEAPPTWRLETDPGGDGTGTLRVISASFDDGALLAVAALRPPGAGGHDADAVGAILVSPEGEASELHHVLLSTEYGTDGRPRRVGLELYEDPADPPTRVVGDRVAETRGGPRGEQIALRLRMEGTSGTGVHELVAPG
jgi:hypothetical protein